jgi:hypothetical protein
MHIKHFAFSVILLFSSVQCTLAQGIYLRFGNLDTMVTSDYVAHKAIAIWPDVLANTSIVFLGGDERW